LWADISTSRYPSWKRASNTTENAAQTALESGHGQAVLFAHYRELVKSKDVHRFFSIKPTRARSVLSMTVAV